MQTYLTEPTFAAAQEKPWKSVVQVVAVLSFLASFTLYIYDTHRWNIVCDSAEMHYIVFLLSRGHAPYVQISDMNMPGTYLVEAAAMAVFGHGDVAWRIYEYLLMTLLGIAGIAIVGRSRWPAGLMATSVFVMMHAADGPYVSTERDEIITVLLACALACLCIALRRRQPQWIIGFGCCAALVVSIKPPFLFADAALFALAVLVLKRERLDTRSYALCALAGHLLITAIVAGFLYRYHAFQALFSNLHTVLPAYATTQRLTLWTLWSELWPGSLSLPASVAAFLLLARHRRTGWLEIAILLLVFIGGFIFIVQGKGYVYHRYIFAYFIFLWIAYVSVAAMTDAQSGNAIRLIGVVAFLALALAQLRYARGLQRVIRGNHYTDSRGVYDVHLALQLDADLNHIGGRQLDGKVLCLETAGSCLNALYRLQLDEILPWTGDLLLFYEKQLPLQTKFRSELLLKQEDDPADVIILGNEWYREKPGNERSFHKIDVWPELRGQLAKDYVPVVRRQGTLEGDTSAYKLLVRKGSAAADMAAAHPLGPPVTEPVDSDP